MRVNCMIKTFLDEDDIMTEAKHNVTYPGKHPIQGTWYLNYPGT